MAAVPVNFDQVFAGNPRWQSSAIPGLNVFFQHAKGIGDLYNDKAVVGARTNCDLVDHDILSRSLCRDLQNVRLLGRLP